MKKCDVNFLGVLNSVFKAFGSKNSCLKEQNKALKDTFFLIYFTVQCLEVLENSYLKK